MGRKAAGSGWLSGLWNSLCGRWCGRSQWWWAQGETDFALKKNLKIMHLNEEEVRTALNEEEVRAQNNRIIK